MVPSAIAHTARNAFFLQGGVSFGPFRPEQKYRRPLHSSYSTTVPATKEQRISMAIIILTIHTSQERLGGAAPIQKLVAFGRLNNGLSPSNGQGLFGGLAASCPSSAYGFV